MKPWRSFLARSLPGAMVGGLLFSALEGVGQELLQLEAVFTGDRELTLSWGPVSEDSRYTVEFSENPGFEPWRPVPPESQWPIAGAQWTDLLPEGQPHRFYRLVETPRGADRGALLASEPVDTLSKFELDLLLLFAGVSGVNVQGGVQVVKLTYETIDAFGAPTVASGAVAIPASGSGPFPAISYQHGTVFDREDVPSRLNTANIESFASVALAAVGHYAIAPDYLGLGDSPGFHPYILAEPSATATLDMIRAAQTYAMENGIALTGELGLVGYSEGGYVTMATHRALEANPIEGFTLAGSAPMAGPYDLAGTMLELALSDQPHPDTSLIGFVMLSYNELYQIVDTPESLFAPGLGEALVAWFREEGPRPASIPETPRALLNPTLVTAIETNPFHPVRIALQQNDLTGWTPQLPMRLYHCAGDRTVPIENSLIAWDRFNTSGAPAVDFFDPDPSADHFDCVLPAVFDAEDWFDALFELDL